VSNQVAGIGGELKRTLKWLVIATIILYLALVGVGFVGWVSASHQRNDLKKATENINSTLCILRGDLETRVAASRQFLLDHPQGISGISVAILQQSIDTQQRTIDALSGLECETG
jgi:hypothetical protein